MDMKELLGKTVLLFIYYSAMLSHDIPNGHQNP
jgi:hypothetical protein